MFYIYHSIAKLKIILVPLRKNFTPQKGMHFFLLFPEHFNNDLANMVEKQFNIKHNRVVFSSDSKNKLSPKMKSFLICVG